MKGIAFWSCIILYEGMFSLFTGTYTEIVHELSGIYYGSVTYSQDQGESWEGDAVALWMCHCF